MGSQAKSLTRKTTKWEYQAELFPILVFQRLLSHWSSIEFGIVFENARTSNNRMQVLEAAMPEHLDHLFFECFNPPTCFFNFPQIRVKFFDIADQPPLIVTFINNFFPAIERIQRCFGNLAKLEQDGFIIWITKVLRFRI